MDHNQGAPFQPSNGLFSDSEKKQFHSFLDTFANTEESYKQKDKNTNSGPSSIKSSSPTPVLLSPPYSKNSTFGQQINLLPVSEPQQQQPSSSFNRKRNNDKEDENNNNNNINHHHMDTKKYRPLVDNNNNISLQSLPDLHNNKNIYRMDHHHSTYSSPPSSSSNSTIPVPISSSSSSVKSSSNIMTTTSSTTTTKPKGSGRGRKPAHELLTEDQKKANHIASEQKRRANIRIGFDQLVDIVPTLSECQRSESLILQKSAEYIRQLVDTKNGLRDRVRELQTVLGEVPDEDSSEGEMDYAF
ncbi:hypothetical protein BJ944DRAFT_266533 [Cunninghamella echinulata]|nr:hypothetical protein BJ944DRAFT_266533 [Cunninghamella echinulata]